MRRPIDARDVSKPQQRPCLTCRALDSLNTTCQIVRARDSPSSASCVPKNQTLVISPTAIATMLAIKSLSLSLGTLLLAAVSSAMEWTTVSRVDAPPSLNRTLTRRQVGYETTEGSRSMQVPLNDCWKFSEE